jgi:hypothetical protein
MRGRQPVEGPRPPCMTSMLSIGSGEVEYILGVVCHRHCDAYMTVGRLSLARVASRCTALAITYGQRSKSLCSFTLLDDTPVTEEVLIAC